MASFEGFAKSGCYAFLVCVCFCLFMGLENAHRLYIQVEKELPRVVGGFMTLGFAWGLAQSFKICTV